MSQQATIEQTGEQVADVGRGMTICWRADGPRDGAPLLLLAGLGQQLNVWPAAFVDGLIDRDFFVIRCDNRDVGRSGRVAAAPPPLRAIATGRIGAEHYTLADMGGDVVGLLDAVEVEAAHLVGMSMGGMIAQTVAARQPQRVLSLTSIMSTTGSRRVGRPALSTQRMLVRRPATARDAVVERQTAMMRHIGSAGYAFDADAVREVAGTGFDRAGGANPAGVGRQLGAILKSGDRTRELRTIAAPTLVIHGDRDPMVDPSGGRATADAIAGARLRTMPGMGHDIPDGAVWQLVEDIAAHAERAGDTPSADAPPRPTRLPPGPRAPKLLLGAQMLANRNGVMRSLQQRYGDAFHVDLPVFGPTVIVAHPDLVKQVFQAPADALVFGESNLLGPILGPGSLFSMDGEQHLRERRLLLPPFHGDRMQSYEAIIEEEARREFATWPTDVEFPTLEGFMRITLNAILRAVFGARGGHLDRLAALLPVSVALGSRLALLPALQRDLGPGSPGRRLLRMRDEYVEIIDTMIDEARADPSLEDRSDVLALLMRAHYDDGETMSRSAIAEELVTLLAAGHETTATSLAWGVERIRRHPQLLARLDAEVAEGGSALRAATITEIQRSRPVIVGTGRVVASRDGFDLGEWHLPKGHRMMVSALRIHHDPRFFERPGAFDPDRFVDRRPDSYTWIPFGGGTRRCIGAAFAQMEMDLVLRTLLQEFSLHPTSDPSEKWRSRGIAFAPARGGRCEVSRR